MSPCLSVDERSLTIVCAQSMSFALRGPVMFIHFPIFWNFWTFYSQDARLTEDIAMCAERYSRGLVQFMDWSPGHNIPVMYLTEKPTVTQLQSFGLFVFTIAARPFCWFESSNRPWMPAFCSFFFLLGIPALHCSILKYPHARSYSSGDEVVS